jgi:hypothetical protein
MSTLLITFQINECISSKFFIAKSIHSNPSIIAQPYGKPGTIAPATGGAAGGRDETGGRA